jgi:ubiquinone/menaquinone biosynthesis C-methylase UbiE
VTAVLLAVGAVVAVTLAVAFWFRTHPSACPYSARFFVQAPHVLITRRRLKAILDPAPGERILEIGPGTGYYTLDMAEWVGPKGQVDIFDIQQEMLDHTMRRAAARGVGNVIPKRGDARRLPYEDNSVDAVVLITVLGEIPDQDQALEEIRRVLKRRGRLIVGELFIDPHTVSLGALRSRAEIAGLEFDRHTGGPLGYYARLSPE